MHEMGLCEAVLAVVRDVAGEEPVSRVRVRTDRLQGVVPEVFQFCWGLAAQDTGAAGADAVLVSGTIGDHGTAIMLARGHLEIEADLESDTAPLHELCAAALAAGDVHLMRDATRGGLATVLNELAREAGLAVAIREE